MTRHRTSSPSVRYGERYHPGSSASEYASPAHAAAAHACWRLFSSANPEIIRQPVKEWANQVADPKRSKDTDCYETHIVYRYSGEDISGEMPQYEISGLPQDYTEIIRDVYEASVSVVYESPSGDMICFDYTYMQQGAANIIAPGDDEILDVTVNGIQGQFFLPHDPADAKTITWIDADSNLQFVVKAFCSETDILHIAESVSLVKTEK